MALPAHRVIGHKEYGNTPPGGYPGRKSDPVYDMNWRRQRVAAFTPRGDDMPTPEEFANAVLDAEVQTPDEARAIGMGPTVTLRAMLRWMDYNFRVVIPNAAATETLNRRIERAPEQGGGTTSVADEMRYSATNFAEVAERVAEGQPQTSPAAGAPIDDEQLARVFARPEVASAFAEALAAVQNRQARDGDPATGPVS